jgi:enterochelin esterase-like enzyme
LTIAFFIRTDAMSSSGIRRIVLAAAICGVAACGDSKHAVSPPPDGPGGDSVPTDTSRSTPSDSVGTIVVDSFASASLGVTKRYLVYLPPSYSSSNTRKYPVAYYLHGYGATERSWVDDLHLDTVLDSLAKSGTEQMIVVMPDGDDSFYHDWYKTPNYDNCLANGPFNNEPASTYCVHIAAYGDYIAQDLVQRIDSKYRTMASAAHRGIAGLSMGGMGAIYLSFTRPTVFGAAASMSGAVLSWVTGGSPPVQAHDTAQLHQWYGDDLWNEYALALQFGPLVSDWTPFDPYTIALTIQTIPPLWMMVGAQDGEALDGNRALHAVLTQRLLSHTYTEESGGHSINFWKAHEREMSIWLAQRIAP